MINVLGLLLGVLYGILIIAILNAYLKDGSPKFVIFCLGVILVLSLGVVGRFLNDDGKTCFELGLIPGLFIVSWIKGIVRFFKRHKRSKKVDKELQWYANAMGCPWVAGNAKKEPKGLYTAGGTSIGKPKGYLNTDERDD